MASRDDFNAAAAFTLRFEGGYVNDPRDPGGETNHGISKRAYPDLDIAKLTASEAREIYYRDYWLPARCNMLPPPLATAMFDYAVNSGPKAAITGLQAIIGTPADGLWGSRTQTALDRALAVERELVTGQALAIKLCSFRLDFLADLKTFPAFGRGWVRRVSALIRAILN